MFWRTTLLSVLVASTTAVCDNVKTTTTTKASSTVAKTSSGQVTTTKISPTTASPSHRSTPASSAAAPTVTDTSRNIRYAGRYAADRAVEKFLNIPYGADTGGPNRFADPRPAGLARGAVVDASAEGPVCPQPAAPGPFPWSAASAPASLSEDCLRLKVARPAGTRAQAGLPVMVYIHGGSFYYGSINDRTTEPDGLVLESVANGLPVVYVAMNYRLNVFGFALNNALQSQDSLNVGLKDQRLALKWVQDNIAYFGGDPSRVTIFGQSSGGLSAALQILAYGGKQPAPFQRAIIQSTALQPNMTGPITAETFSQVASRAGCAGGDGRAQGGATIQCLRRLPTDQLWAAAQEVTEAYAAAAGGDVWLPAVDGGFLPAAPSRLLAEGRLARGVAVVAGWTRDDAAGGTPFAIRTAADTRAFVAAAYPYLRPAALDALLRLYPAADFEGRAAAPGVGLSAEFFRAAQVYRDVLFVCPTFLLGHAVATAYRSSSSSSSSSGGVPPPVYYYEHNQTIYGAYAESLGLAGLGAVHESELPYVFADFAPYAPWAAPAPGPAGDADRALRPRVSRSWSAFAAGGAPSRGAGTLQGWRAAYAGGAGAPGPGGMMAASVFAVGGPTPGMAPVSVSVSGADGGGAVADERLAARCGFLNSADVIQQLRY